MNVNLHRSELEALLRFVETSDNDKFAFGILYDENKDNAFKNAVYELEEALNRDVYINVYAVTRHFGGPEEGGWWYNAGEILESKQCHPELVNSVRAELEAKYADQKEGDIYSVRGGVDIEVQLSDEPGEDFPKHTPHYE